MKSGILTRIALWSVFAAVVLLLTSCGGHGGRSVFTLASPNAGTSNLIRDVMPPAPDQARMAELEAALSSELAALGKDISDTSSLPPSQGCEVVDLAAVVLDPDVHGQMPPYGVSIRWTERLIGDYDQNGMVNASDLTPLGMYFGYKVLYDNPELHEGIGCIPAGDPEDFGDVPPDQPPAPDSGAFNWRLARIDGDHNGVININDITQIAQHWNEALTGYIVYKMCPSSTDFEEIPNALNQTVPATISRFDLLEERDGSYSNLTPVRYALADILILEDRIAENEYCYKVAPYNSKADACGPESAEVIVKPFADYMTNDGLLPRLEASLISQGGASSAAVGGLAIEGIAPLTVQFDASSSYVPAGQIPNYLWDFNGDGIFEHSSGDNPIQEYTYEDNARIAATMRLVSVPADGGHSTSKAVSTINSKTASQQNNGSITYIEIVVISPEGNYPPVAQATANPCLGIAPLTVQFDAAECLDPDGSIAYYEWDFDGDGSADYSSQSPAATYAYGQPAFYTAMLRVTDDDGGYAKTFIQCIASDESGHWPPMASLVANPTAGATPLAVTLSGRNSVDPDGYIATYEWDLNGDFTFDINSGTESEISYVFAESALVNVWLKITDSQGLTSMARALITVNTPPYGGLEATPDTGPGPLTVELDASSSEDLDGTIVKYEWDFNSDGTYDQDTGILPRTTHTFYLVGENVVTLRITDNLGESSTHSITIDVLEPVNNLTPEATLEADVMSGAPPLRVEFTASGHDPDEDGGIDHFNWDFEGDGIIDEQTSILGTIRTFTYQSAGRYNPTVYVVDVLGGIASASLEIVAAQGGNDPPRADFTIDPIGSPPGEPITFDAGASTDDSSIASYAWDFECDGAFDVQGNAASARQVSRSFDVLGVHKVLLRVTDDDGAIAYAWKNVVVGHVPKLTIVSDADYAEVPGATFNLDASRSTGEEGYITLFEWDLNGDGLFELQTGVSPFVAATYDFEDLAAYPGGVVHPRLRATNEIGAVAETDVIKMGARDENGEPLRDQQGNLVLDEDGLPLLEDVELTLYDDFDEVEDNDGFLTANKLVGPESDGSFSPDLTGAHITAVRSRFFTGDEIELTRTDPLLGSYVAGSVGDRNLARVYDSDDEDWYVFELSDGAHIQLDLHFDGSAETDLILRLYDVNGITVLTQSDLEGNEQINYDFRDPGIYYTRVNRFVGQGQDYRLALAVTPLTYYPEAGIPDTNNSEGSADSLHDPLGSGLIPLSWGRADKATDPVDWYYFNYSSEVTTRVRLNFAHRIGDLDLYLYNKDLALLGYSNTSNDGEELWRALPEPSGAEPVYVKVVAQQGGPVNYTLSAGYPAGPPTDVVASKGTADGLITISWNPPPAGGNAPNGYKLYCSDDEDGYYWLLATINNPNPLPGEEHIRCDHDLRATADMPWQNEILWYKVVSTRTGELDSDPSDPVYGFVNDVRPAVGLYASTDEYLDKVVIGFYDAPHDPILGTGKFGVEPNAYRVYADPVDDPDNKPNTLIRIFYPGQGTPVTVPSFGDVPQRDGEWFSFEWSGAPDWTAPVLRGLPIEFTVLAQAPSNLYTSQLSPAETGRIAGLNTPTDLWATNGLFSNKVRVRWTDNVTTVPPDSYILQFQGEYEIGWTNVSDDPIPYFSGQSVYEYWVEEAGGAPPSGIYRVRAYKEGVGYSPWSNEDYGYASDNGLLEPNEDNYDVDWWYVEDDQRADWYYFKASLGQPPDGSIVPQTWAFEIWTKEGSTGSWYCIGGSNSESFDRETAINVHPSSVYYGELESGWYWNYYFRLKIKLYWQDLTEPSTNRDHQFSEYIGYERQGDM